MFLLLSATALLLAPSLRRLASSTMMAVPRKSCPWSWRCSRDSGVLPSHWCRASTRTAVRKAHLGHSPYLESPGALTQLIVRFLEGGRATEAAAAGAPGLRTAP